MSLLAGAGTDGEVLDSWRIALADGSRIVGEPARKLEGITSSGPALDGWQAATPDLAGLWMDFKRFPGDAWEIRPIDQRWPNADRNWLVQQ